MGSSAPFLAETPYTSAQGRPAPAVSMDPEPAWRPPSTNFRPRRELHLGKWAAALWLSAVVVAALSAPWLPLQDPTAMQFMHRAAPPSAEHWLGTDGLGRDLLARVAHGGRASLGVGVGASLLGVVTGALVGLFAGCRRGWTEKLLIGVVDVMLAFPPLVLALVLTAYFGQSVLNLTLVLGVLTLPAAARVTRALVLSVASREYVIAARALGATELRIMFREVLPNIASQLLAFFLLALAVIVVAEGALSFLGLGVPPPMSSWGSMIADGRNSLESAPHVALIPAAVMFVTVLCANVLGDGVQTSKLLGKQAR